MNYIWNIIKTDFDYLNKKIWVHMMWMYFGSSEYFRISIFFNKHNEKYWTISCFFLKEVLSDDDMDQMWWKLTKYTGK